jgi:hypothetical protein
VTIGGVGGLLLGVMNGLPVVPEAKLKVNSFALFCSLITTITSQIAFATNTNRPTYNRIKQTEMAGHML